MGTKDTARRPTRRWENRMLVREVDRHRALWYWGLIAGMIVAATPGALYLMQKNAGVELGYETTALREQLDGLLEEERRLRVERATLESLETIESWALRRHGMVRPTAEQVVVVRESGSPPRDLLAGLPGAERSAR